MRKVSVGILILLVSLFLFSCKSNDKNTTNQFNDSLDNLEVTLPEEDNIETETNDLEETTDPVEAVGENNEIPVVDPTGKIFSKLTGLEITNEQSIRRPVVVMLDNHYLARPQGCLSDADVIYEVLAEGLITRYMAVFQTNEPDIIGPVRSSRPYFIERALEYNPLYVHVGGSMQALSDIIKYEMADIDGLSVGGGVFYRTDHKDIPHNMYSSTSGIRKEADRKKYNKEVDFEGQPIGYQIVPINGELANHIKVVYKSPSSGDAIGYYISYTYDVEKQTYLRYVNGKEHLDETTKIHLTADNIIVQQVGHRVIDNEGRRDIDMVGSGSGYYFNRGQWISITWEKTGERTQTRYFKSDGSELILNPGITWIQVVPTSTEPIID
ncbi:MAG: DUF3048 domain-containing protein [Clostridia bacterium]|nr:DUF3048 domain-containing protein [Clostridia bacterium]